MKHQLLVAAGVLLRLWIIWNTRVLGEGNVVAYTDIDYHVFSRAGQYILAGESPFKHPTYRYPPILALIMAPNSIFYQWGKLVLLVADVALCYLISALTKQKVLGLVYLLNPLVVYLTTRGSFDGLSLLLTMGFLGTLVKGKYFTSGLLYGFSVHFRIYTVIFSPAVFMFLRYKTHTFVSRELIKFGLAAGASFLALTLGSQALYPGYLQQGLLYHLSRKDYRHSYSPWFYPAYLSSDSQQGIQGLVISLVQACLVIGSGIRLAKEPYFATFVQTWIFILFNKVYTLQYMLWLSIGLLAMPNNIVFIEGKRKAVFAYAMLLLLGILIWWYFSIKLEGKGEPVLKWLWASSLFLICTQGWVLSRLIDQQQSPIELARIKNK